MQSKVPDTMNSGLTVAGLIARLQELPQDMLVHYHDDWRDIVVTSVEVTETWTGGEDGDEVEVAYLKGRAAIKEEGLSGDP